MANAEALSAPVAQAVRLCKRYGRREALREVSIAVAPGELYGLIGPDGGGKSSLMKALAGVLSCEGGSVQVLGRRIASEREAEAVKDRIGFMPQGLGLNLYPNLSVEENIDFFADLRAVPRADLQARKARLLAMTRLDAFRQRPMAELSGGMKQKLGLVCTLIHAPQLIILDEPTTGIDPLSRRDFWRLLPELMHEQRMSAIVSTAYLDEASRFDRVGLLYDGLLLAEGEPDALPDLEELFVAKVRALQPQAEAPLRPPDGEGSGPASRNGNGPAIEAAQLTRDFGRFRAADAVSFRVAPGEIFGLLGANGAGKTTVIKMLTGILPPSGGIGQVAGADMRHASRQIRRRIGYMSQAFSLYADLSVRENLMLYAGIYGLPHRLAQQRTGWAAELGGLQAHLEQPASSLPMGLRQRLALGCALLHRPQVLFLDEPTSGVDPLGRQRFWRILEWLARDERVSILITTHHMPEAERCDHLVLMYDGRVVADASPAEMKRALRDEAGSLVELRCPQPLRALQLLQAAGHADAMLHGRGVRLLVPNADDAARRLPALLAAQDIAPAHVLPREIGMEDVFLHRVGRLQAHAPA